jgi:hypothetical protein
LKVSYQWSPYENAAEKALGCTNYAGSNDRMETAMKRGISNAVSVFSLPLADLYIREVFIKKKKYINCQNWEGVQPKSKKIMISD